MKEALLFLAIFFIAIGFIKLIVAAIMRRSENGRKED